MLADFFHKNYTSKLGKKNCGDGTKKIPGLDWKKFSGANDQFFPVWNVKMKGGWRPATLLHPTKRMFLCLSFCGVITVIISLLNNWKPDFHNCILINYNTLLYTNLSSYAVPRRPPMSQTIIRLSKLPENNICRSASQASVLTEAKPEHNHKLQDKIINYKINLKN